MWGGLGVRKVHSHLCMFFFLSLQVPLCESWHFELCQSLLPLVQKKGVKADVTLDSWHSMLSPSPSLRWPSEWQLWQKGGNELRAKKVIPIKIRLDITIGVGTLFHCSTMGWQVFLDTHFARYTPVAEENLCYLYFFFSYWFSTVDCIIFKRPLIHF